LVMSDAGFQPGGGGGRKAGPSGAPGGEPRKNPVFEASLADRRGKKGNYLVPKEVEGSLASDV